MTDLFTIRCGGCGASVVYEAGSEKLRCPYCGHQQEIPLSYEGIEEIDLEHALKAAEAQREAIPEHQILSCRSCGAQIAYKEGRAKCDFCGAEAVSEGTLQNQPIRPQGVLPFGIDARAAQETFTRWVKNLWFAPSDLSHRTRLEDLRGIYLPSWTFDARVWAHWTATPGYYRTRTEPFFDQQTRTWKTRTVTYTEWGAPISGHHQDFFDDVLISGLNSLPNRYLEEIGSFATTTDLRTYNPSYFLGWDVALPDKPLPEAWKEGYEYIHAKTAEACKKAIPGDTYKDFRMQIQLSGLTTKLVYVPIYILAYRYGDKPYRVVIHGRTGAVTGDRPISWVKVGLAVLLIAAIIGLLAYLAK
ncbi:MAG: hypothetical protein NZZ60_01295 [Bacteroidia bacterium]|nr:hypothetical protein [Bacteroidia bacterium]MCX7652731.1 hypothetical protein [Bacteroidia bacterium]MDW8416385.1 hypothetical protein [Bacteroidia bacterium]